MAEDDFERAKVALRKLKEIRKIIRKLFPEHLLTILQNALSPIF